MDCAEEEKGPVRGKAPDVGGAIEVVGTRLAYWQWPVEGGEFGRLITGRGRAVDALDEAGGC